MHVLRDRHSASRLGYHISPTSRNSHPHSHAILSASVLSNPIKAVQSELLCISKSTSMASSMKRAKRGKFCVCRGPVLRSCTNTNHVEGISMHKFPANEEEWKIWIKFVRKHWPNFTPTNSSVCSAHFEKSCFGTRYHIDVPDELKPKARYVSEGSVPTKDSVILEEMPATLRTKRRVSDVLHSKTLLFNWLLENIIANSFALL